MPADRKEGDGGSLEPLLSVSVDVPDVNDTAETQDRQIQGDGGAKTSVQKALYRNPREAIKWLESEGVKKLGTFRVQSNKTKSLRTDPAAMQTLGADRRDIDWEATWREVLDAADPPTSGPEWHPVTEVDAYVVDIANAADADDNGIVNPLIKRYNDGICGLRVFSYPATKAVLHYKWSTWARRYLIVEMLDYFVWLIAFQAFVLLLQDEDMHMSLKQILGTPRGIATVVLECVSFAAMLPFIYIEIRTVQEYWDDWLNAWNFLDVAAYAFQTVILVMHLGRLQIDSNAFSIVCAIQVLLLWIRVQYFARVLQPTKNPFIETMRAVISEVKYFLFLLILLVVAFANSFNILFRKDQAETEDFRTVWSSWLSLFIVMVSGIDDIKTYSKSHNALFAVVLLVIFVFIMTVLLLNILIALMSDAAAKVNEHEKSQFQLSRACIIDELETTLPAFFRLKNAKTWYPRYIHFIKVNHDYESVKMLDLGMSTEDTKGGSGSDSSECGEEGSSGDGKAGDGAAEEVTQLKSELAEVREQMGRMLEIQEAMARATLSKGACKSLFDR